MKKLLIIGGGGFIGLHLIKALSRENFKLTVVCRNTKNIGFRVKNAKIIQGDIKDYRLIEKLVGENDIIMNLASVIQHGVGFNPFLDLEVNCLGQLNILESRRKVNPSSVFINLSTRSQFGRINKKDMPIKEHYCQRPLSLYGIHKSAAENYCNLYRRAYGLKSIIIRLPQVYGPGLSEEQTHNVIDKFVKMALSGKEFVVNGYGKDIKDVVFVDDIVDLLVKVLKSKVRDGTFNAGSGKGISLLHIAKKVIDLCDGGKIKLAPYPKETAEFEMGDLYFDISKIKMAFDWSPKISLDEGIKKTIEFYS